MLNNLLNCQLQSISRVADMVKLDFVSIKKIVWCLHVQQALFRVLENDKLIISNSDMSIRGKNFIGKKFKWDVPGNNLFDEQVMLAKNKLVGMNVKALVVNGDCFALTLDNGLRIEIISYTLKTDSEYYRFFKQDSNEPHFVVGT